MELTHGNAAQRDATGLKSGFNPLTSPHFPTVLVVIPNQRGTTVIPVGL